MGLCPRSPSAEDRAQYPEILPGLILPVFCRIRHGLQTHAALISDGTKSLCVFFLLQTFALPFLFPRTL